MGFEKTLYIILAILKFSVRIFLLSMGSIYSAVKDTILKNLYDNNIIFRNVYLLMPHQINKMPHYEKQDVFKDFLLPNIESQRLEEILSDIEKQKAFRIFGYILIPIIIGFFILKKLNNRILVLTNDKDELTKRFIIELETSNNQIKNNLIDLIWAGEK